MIESDESTLIRLNFIYDCMHESIRFGDVGNETATGIQMSELLYLPTIHVERRCGESVACGVRTIVGKIVFQNNG
jgi:hypothetical protein